MRMISACVRATLLLGMLALASAMLSQAATPTAVNFQGRLTDAGGTPVPDGSYSVVFTIYDAATGGGSKWTETQSIATAGGLFTVLLGTVTPIVDTVFNNTTRYLGVKVGSDPEIVPRTRMVTTPYACRVSTVDGSTGGIITGNIDLGNSIATSGNILKGGVPFLHNYGINNTFVGKNAGNLTMSGRANLATGAGSLASNDSGSFNTATGVEALFSNSSGSGNTASGYEALALNTTGSHNVAIAPNALFNNSTADNNVAIGFAALSNNSTGSENIAIGRDALLQNTNGSQASAFGYQAMHDNTSGRFNVGIGSNALSNNTTGERNVAVGVNALTGNLTGSSNMALGAGAHVSVDGLTNATAIGADAIVDASNKVRIGSAGVTVVEGPVAFTFTSDRNRKENFRPVDGDDVLRKIRGFGLTSWNYKEQDSNKFRHYGPMAQDFFAAFGHDAVGQCGDSITMNSGDEAGILFVAVKALERRTAEFAQVEAENELLSSKVETTSAENKGLRTELNDLKRKIDQMLAEPRQRGSAGYSAK